MIDNYDGDDYYNKKDLIERIFTFFAFEFIS